MIRSILGGFALCAGCHERLYGPCSGANELVDARVDVVDGTPAFDWDLGTAYALSVDELDDDGEIATIMWHIQCGGDNLEEGDELANLLCIETPIAYGERIHSPTFDSMNHVPPKELTPGATYQLRLDTLVEDDGPTPESKLPEWLGFLDHRAERDDSKCGSGFTAEVDFVAGEAE